MSEAVVNLRWMPSSLHLYYKYAYFFPPSYIVRNTAWEMKQLVKFMHNIFSTNHSMHAHTKYL